jgi:hypothetical protein
MMKYYVSPDSTILDESAISTEQAAGASEDPGPRVLTRIQ